MKKDSMISKTGQIIQEKRMQLGMTQQGLADALHVTDKAVSKWERGLCFPDVSLLSKLSLILDVDLDVLISKSININDWVGLIDINNCDFSQLVYDKPLVYYILSHYLLLGINKIHIITNSNNEKFLKSSLFERFGFKFYFYLPKDKNIMLINHPWFLFGSDLTQQFQGAMLLNKTIKLIPDNQSAVFYFISKDKIDLINNQNLLTKKVTSRTLGRGMLALDMADYEKCIDAATFIKIYQNNTNMLIGSLEEILYKKGCINEIQLKKILENKPYAKVIYNSLSKPQVE